MQGSIIIYGGNTAEREARIQLLLKELKLSVKDFNVMLIDLSEGKKSIGIEQIKQGLTFLENKPTMSLHKAVVIYSADSITKDGQNALLKTLEEPPEYATVILVAKNSDSMLPTVRSRCRFVGIRKSGGEVGEGRGEGTAVDLRKMTIGERLTWAEETSKEEKEVIIEMLQNIVAAERNKLTNDGPDKELYASNIAKILGIKEDLERTNVNARLALEHLALSIK